MEKEDGIYEYIVKSELTGTIRIRGEIREGKWSNLKQWRLGPGGMFNADQLKDPEIILLLSKHGELVKD